MPPCSGMPISRNACLQRCLLLHEGERGCGCCCCAGRVRCHHETRGSGTCFYEIILGTVRCKRLSLKCEKEDGELKIGVFLQCLNKVQSRGNSLLCASWGGGDRLGRDNGKATPVRLLPCKGSYAHSFTHLCVTLRASCASAGYTWHFWDGMGHMLCGTGAPNMSFSLLMLIVTLCLT